MRESQLEPALLGRQVRDAALVDRGYPHDRGIRRRRRVLEPGVLGILDRGLGLGDRQLLRVLGNHLGIDGRVRLAGVRLAGAGLAGERLGTVRGRRIRARRAEFGQALLIGRRPEDRLCALDRGMPECIAEPDPQLLGGHRRQGPAPLQPVGPVGGSLDHLLQLVGIELDQVGVRCSRLLEGRAQPLEQGTTTALGYSLRDLLVRVGHETPSSRCDLTAVRNREACRP